ncbi:MAG: DUF1559 domain-containing protein [Planctomycetia bacterium]|nr:DUF1559 domain-containing protein [Planctomycetia bacterium]
MTMPPPSRRGVSLVELLVCLAIIGILVSLSFPAIHSVRAGMARAECADHKRQLSLALDMYCDAHRGLLPPPPTPPAPGGWAREILPFMEERALFEALDVRLPVSAPGNAQAARSRPPMMRCMFAPWRDSDVAGVPPSDFVLVVTPDTQVNQGTSRPGPRRTKDFSAWFYHAPQDATAPWPVSVEIDRDTLGRRQAADQWPVWHPAAPTTGLGSLTDEGL